MANIKTITKKLVNLGFSENKLMMMTEKEIREAYKTLKEESIMKNHTNEVETINSETTVETVEKEETIMTNTTNDLATRTLNMNRVERLMHVRDSLTHATKTTDEFYIKKEELVQFLFDNDIISRMPGKNELKKTKRQEFVDILMTAVQNLIDAKVITPINAVPVGDLDITHDNAPEPIEESPATVVFNDGLALKILEGVIRQADTNKAHNFISDWMLTSIISELVLGHPLKDKGHEYYKSFTDEQRKILVDMRKAFINKTHLITKTNNGKVTGYYIPAKVLVWGRHVHLGVACVYRYVNNNKILAEYHVSLNGIKNVATGNITVLDDAAYETLDTKCVFVM